MIEVGESRIICSSPYEAGNQPPNTLQTSQQGQGNGLAGVAGYLVRETGEIIFPENGWWAVEGIAASLFGNVGGIASGSNLDIQLTDMETGKDWFGVDAQNASASGVPTPGAPLEAVAGKWGSTRWLKHPHLVKPGARLRVRAANFVAGGSPSTRTPIYVALMARLLGDSPLNEPWKQISGFPMIVPFRFDSSTTNWQAAQKIEETQPLGSPEDYYITSLMTRVGISSSDLTENPADFISGVDPRQQTTEILMELKGSSKDSTFFIGGPAPISLVAGLFGARNSALPTYFKLKKGDSLRMGLFNYASTTISDKVDVTVEGVLARS